MRYASGAIREWCDTRVVRYASGAIRYGREARGKKSFSFKRKCCKHVQIGKDHSHLRCIVHRALSIRTVLYASSISHSLFNVVRVAIDVKVIYGKRLVNASLCEIRTEAKVEFGIFLSNLVYRIVLRAFDASCLFVQFSLLFIHGMHHGMSVGILYDRYLTDISLRCVSERFSFARHLMHDPRFVAIMNLLIHAKAQIRISKTQPTMSVTTFTLHVY